MKPKSQRGGSHALKKRCPFCRKLRKFYRWDDGFTAFARLWRAEHWTKIGDQWCCRTCFDRRAPEPVAEV